VEQAFAFCRNDLIEPVHLPPELRRNAVSISESIGPMTLQDMEKILITDLMIQNSGNRSLTAKALGINTSTLYRKIRTMGINVPATDGRSHGRMERIGQ
jgi:transcriptional regulator of acetoin/glycerol metabolism